MYMKFTKVLEINLTVQPEVNIKIYMIKPNNLRDAFEKPPALVWAHGGFGILSSAKATNP